MHYLWVWIIMSGYLLKLKIGDFIHYRAKGWWEPILVVIGKKSGIHPGPIASSSLGWNIKKNNHKLQCEAIEFFNHGMKSKDTRGACKPHTEMEPNLKAFLLWDNGVNHWWLLMLQIKKNNKVKRKPTFRNWRCEKTHLNALCCIPQARLKTLLLCFWLMCHKFAITAL